MSLPSDELLGRRVERDVNVRGRASSRVSILEPLDAFRVESADDTLDAFIPESSARGRRLPRVRAAVAALPSLVAAALTTAIRNGVAQKLVVAAAAVACLLLGLVMVGRMLNGSETVSSSAVSASSLPDETATAPVAPARSKKPAADRGSAVRSGAAADLGRRPGTGERPRSAASTDGSTIAPAGTSPLGSAVPAPSDIADAAPLPALSAAVAPDLAVYSDADGNVQPPTPLSVELPRPTFETWRTSVNTMELIISESGAVERVRLLTPPQRMPDMMVLSRAKMWKFGPAVKDGRPVRYRLILKWEVNP
jgi:hypothetical protein